MPTPSNKYDKEHQRRVKAVERMIDAIYAEAVKEAAALGVTIDMPEGAKPFTFDDYPLTKKRIDDLLATLRSQLEVAIVNAADSAWTLANEKNNELCNWVFGNAKDHLTPAQQRKYYNNNDKAREAFLQRKERGLNLSDRVWRYTDMFKTEIEMGLDLGIREGKDAASMARDLKQYLKYPDKLFRRVRDEHGILHLSKAAAAFHPGRGVYRSSYRNARRLAATETNIAYRTSDHERWQQLDFVVGIEVNLSSNHTCLGRDGAPHEFMDICDELKGKYPKDFKFVGWHPHCRCFATSILKTPEEMARDRQSIINGEDVSGESGNTIEEMPKGFTDWVEKNETRIENAKQLPYFLRDNGKMVDGHYQLSVGRKAHTPPRPTIAQRAAQRHQQRTKEQADAIREKWQRRQADKLVGDLMDGNLPQRSIGGLNKIYNSLGRKDYDDAARRIKLLQTASKRHAARTAADVRRIQDMADERAYGKEYVENVHRIEAALGMKRGKRMSHADANTGRVNPSFGRGGYKTNCSACSGTYILRRMGFDVEAKPNNNRNPIVMALSRGETAWDKWKDGIGTYAKTRDWMDKNGVLVMDKDAYMRFLNENTKEVGIYEFNIGYMRGGGHSTLLERRKDGTLVRIEQQVSYNPSLDGLLGYLTTSPPRTPRGIMRVDNAQFNPAYASAVRKVKKKR